MFGISKHEIEQKIKGQLLKKLAADREVVIAGVGTLRQMDDGELKFYASNSFKIELEQMQNRMR